MTDAPVARTDHELRILEALVDCAHVLSVGVAEAAKAERDHARKLQLFEAFQRGFLAVRMGIRLSIQLREGARAVARPAAAPARDAPEVERPETEPRETERPESLERERDRDRDRDYEPVSLPKFLSTLGVLASDAARLPGLPAHVRTDLLPRLGTLLARAKAPATQASAPAAAVALLTRPKAPPKSALLSATSAFSAQPLAFHGQPRPPPYRST